MIFQADGWLKGVRHCPSTHYNARPAGVPVSLAVIHFISLPAGEFGGDDVRRLFCGELTGKEHPSYGPLTGLRVSSHFFIRRTGEIIQFVSVKDRAWHAGVSVFEGVPDCNNYAVGIELEGTGEVPYTAAQYAQLSRLLVLINAYTPLTAVTGHEHIAPHRKQDPGPSFHWARLMPSLPASVRLVTEPQT